MHKDKGWKDDSGIRSYIVFIFFGGIFIGFLTSPPPLIRKLIIKVNTKQKKYTEEYRYEII